MAISEMMGIRKILGQAMWPIGREGGDGSVQCLRSLISSTPFYAFVVGLQCKKVISQINHDAEL